MVDRSGAGGEIGDYIICRSILAPMESERLIILGLFHLKYPAIRILAPSSEDSALRRKTGC